MKMGRAMALAVLFSPAAAADLTWAELAQRPEFWPGYCTLRPGLTPPDGNNPTPAEQLRVVAVREDQVDVATADGRNAFTVHGESTDVLAAAIAEWKNLLPDQRALTYATVLQRKDLWPYRVKLVRSLPVATGSLPRGESLVLKEVEGSELLLVHEKSQARLHLSVRDTDLLDLARQRLVDGDAFPGRIAEDLRGRLVAPSTGAPAPLDDGVEPQVYAFYRGAAWCEPCRLFSPSLLNFHGEMKRRYPGFEVIYVSADRSASEMAGYAKEAGFSWRTVTAMNLASLPIVSSLFTTAIPQLVVTDRHGNVLVNSMPAGPHVALKQLEVVLRKGASARPETPR